jgi:hypothetical protein
LNTLARLIILATLAVAATALLWTSIDSSRDAGAFGAPKLTPSPTRTPVKPTPTATPTAKPAPPAPAINPALMATECLGGGSASVRAFFLWGPSGSGNQWLDLSIFNDGFAPGRFVGVGPLGPKAWGFVWDGLSQGTTHYLRVNTLTREGWKASASVAFYTPVCDPAAYSAPVGGDMWALRDRLAGAMQRSGINAAIAVTDLRTGETIDINGANVRLPGCTINLFVLMKVVEELQFGRYPEPVPGDLIGQTINRSDPITSRRLMRDWIGGGDLYRGVGNVQAFIQSLGMTSTLMDHPPAYPHETLYRAGDNRITALDANRGLKAIWDGRVLNPGWRDYFLQKMTLVKPGLNYLVSVGTGGSTVSHKNGFLYAEGWADNDIGIVWFERGGQRYGYAISYYSQNLPGKYDGIPLGQTLSSLTYAWFDARYGAP